MFRFLLLVSLIALASSNFCSTDEVDTCTALLSKCLNQNTNEDEPCECYSDWSECLENAQCRSEEVEKKYQLSCSKAGCPIAT